MKPELYTVLKKTARSLALVCALLAASPQAYSNACGLPHVGGGGGGAATSLPDTADPDANIKPMPATDATVDNAAEPGPKADAQTCDPTLDRQIYRNLESYYCMQSSSADCMKSLEMILHVAEIGAEKLAIGMIASIVVMGVNDIFEAWFTNPAAKAQALKMAKDEARALHHPDLLDNPAFAKLKEDLDNAPSARRFRALIKEFNTLNRSAEARAALEQTTQVIPKKWTLKTMGGLMAVGTAAASANEMNIFQMGLDSSLAPCKAEPGYEWIGTDPGNQCRPTFKITSNVSKFLELPHDKKMEILNKEPAVCQYYKKFNDSLRNWLKPSKTVSNISCSGDQISYEIGEGDKHMKLALRVGDGGKISSMTASRIPAKPQSSTWLNDFSVGFADHDKDRVIDKISFDGLPELNSKEPPKKIMLSYDQALDDSTGSRLAESYAPVIASGLQMHKMYSTLVKACCEMKDDSLQQQCKTAIEKPDAKSLRELEKNTTSSGAPAAK